MMFTWIDGRLLLAGIVIVVACYLFVAAMNAALQADADRRAQAEVDRGGAR